MTSRPAVAEWLRSAPSTGTDFEVVTAAELALMASNLTGKRISIEVVIAAAFDARLPVRESSPWSFGLPAEWIAAQRNPTALALQHILDMLQEKKP